MGSICAREFIDAELAVAITIELGDECASAGRRRADRKPPLLRFNVGVRHDIVLVCVEHAIFDIHRRDKC